MEKFLVSREFGPCPECKSELLHHCVKNGVKFVQGGRKDPIAVWNCDLYKLSRRTLIQLQILTIF